VSRTPHDCPPALEHHNRHLLVGLDVAHPHAAAARFEQSLGDPDAAQDCALPHPWPFRQAELGDSYEFPEVGTSEATSEIGMVSPQPGMRVEDYYMEGRRGWFRLHEKGGKRHEVPAHHNAETYLDAYIEAAGIANERKTPLFRTIDRRRQLTTRPMHRMDAWRIIKRRAQAIGLPEDICNHTFRATGITAYLENGGTIEHAQQIANHESPKTTKLYDRTSDQITLDEVERIVI